MQSWMNIWLLCQRILTLIWNQSFTVDDQIASGIRWKGPYILYRAYCILNQVFGDRCNFWGNEKLLNKQFLLNCLRSFFNIYKILLIQKVNMNVMFSFQKFDKIDFINFLRWGTCQNKSSTTTFTKTKKCLKSNADVLLCVLNEQFFKPPLLVYFSYFDPRNYVLNLWTLIPKLPVQ